MVHAYMVCCLQVCWVIISPLLLIAILVAALIDWTKPSYGSIPYPEWAHGVGWTLTLISVLQIPIWFLVIVIRSFFKKYNTGNPLTCTQSWLDRRDLTQDFVHANISILERKDGCKVNMSSKNMTSSTTSSSISSIGSYIGTMQPEPGMRTESKTCI